MDLRTRQEFVEEKRASTHKIEVVIGEGRTLDPTLLLQLKEIALSSPEFTPGEKDYFLTMLKHSDFSHLEDWEMLKFISIAEKGNVKIVLLGKPHIVIESTNKSKNVLITTIKECYKRESFTKLRPVLEDIKMASDISQAYVNLAIVMKGKSDTENKSDNTELFEDSRMTSSYEQIYGKKEDIPMVKLFSPLQAREVKTNQQIKTHSIPKRLLIEGWAGIGKTVLCQYLTVMWARDSQEIEKRWWLEDTEVVLWVRLRNLTNYDSKNCCIGEVVRRECFGVKDSKDSRYPSAIQIQADLEALGDKVTFILDGFDEVADWYEEYVDDSSQTLTPRSELLTNELLGQRHKHRVILTSRPSRTEEIESHFDRTLETIGFKDSDIKRYVKDFFIHDERISQSLLSSMRKNRNLWGIAHIPLNLALVCLVSQRNKEKSQIFEAMTITNIYSDTVLWLLRCDWEKHPIWNEEEEISRRRRMMGLGGKSRSLRTLGEKDIRSDARELTWEEFELKLNAYSAKIKFLEELAWQAQTSKQHDLLISGEVVVEFMQRYYENRLKNVEQLELLKEIRKLGLLESQYNEDDILVKDNNFYFPHLTFQEYFAAKYWVRKYTSEKAKEVEEAVKLFKQYKYYFRFELLWCFVSGLLLERSKANAQRFIELFCDQPKEIGKIRHISLLIRLLEESQIVVRCDDHQYKRFFDEIDQEVMNLIKLIEKMLSDDSYYDTYDLFDYYKELRDSLQQCPQTYFYLKIFHQLNETLTSSKPQKINAIFMFLSFVRSINDNVLNSLLSLFGKYLQEDKLTVDHIKGMARFFILYLRDDLQEKWIQFFISVINKYTHPSYERNLGIVAIESMRTFPLSEFTENNQRFCISYLNCLMGKEQDIDLFKMEVFKTLCRFLTLDLQVDSMEYCMEIILNIMKDRYGFILNNLDYLGSVEMPKSNDRFIDWEPNVYSISILSEISQEMKQYFKEHHLFHCNEYIEKRQWEKFFGEIKTLPSLQKHEILLILLVGVKDQIKKERVRILHLSTRPMRILSDAKIDHLKRWNSRNVPISIRERVLEELIPKMQRCIVDLMRESNEHITIKWIYIEATSRLSKKQLTNAEIEHYAQWLFNALNGNDDAMHLGVVRSILRCRLTRLLSDDQLEILNQIFANLMNEETPYYRIIKHTDSNDLILCLSTVFNEYFPSFENKREFLKGINENIIINAYHRRDNFQNNRECLYDFFVYYCIFNRCIVYLNTISNTVELITRNGTKINLKNDGLYYYIEAQQYNSVLDNLWCDDKVNNNNSSSRLSSSPYQFILHSTSSENNGSVNDVKGYMKK